MKNNITVLLWYFENKGGAVAGETNLLLGSLVCSNRFCEGTLVFASLDQYSIEQPTFLLLILRSHAGIVVDESLGIPALMLPLKWYFLFINYSFTS